METFTMKKTKKGHQDDPVDQANLDLGFIEAFVDMFYQIEEPDALQSSTIAAMCHESKFKIERLKSFISSIPLKAVRAA